MEVSNSIENAQNTIMRAGKSFNLHASEIHVSETCGAYFISSKGSFCKKLCMELINSIFFQFKTALFETIPIITDYKNITKAADPQWGCIKTDNKN